MIECYIKTIYGDRIDLNSKFMRDLMIEKSSLSYFFADMKIDNKEYMVVNIPIVILKTYADDEIYEILSKSIKKANVTDTIFDYSKWLMG